MDIMNLSNLARFKDIIFIFIKYGFDDLVERLDLPFDLFKWKRSEKTIRLGPYARLRMAFEDLGPTFIKFGQILSLRPDLVTPDIAKEFSKLQDEVAQVSFAEIKKQVEKNLGQPLHDIFSVFEEEPIAAASLSQVHKAIFRFGGPVLAVKVQRPAIRSIIETDLSIMEAIAEKLNDRYEDLQVYDLPNLVRVTRQSLFKELDFTKESRYMQIAGSNLSDNPDVYIPQVFNEYSTEQILTMEFIRGIKLKDMHFTKPEESEELAGIGLKAAIKQIFENGFFHADPHPGNILISEGNLICLIDWGMVGRLTESDRFILVDMIQAVVNKDSHQLVEAALKISIKDKPVDRDDLERDLLDIIDLYVGVPIKDIHLGKFLNDLTYTLRQNHLRIPPDLAIMIKALITIEGTARQLCPGLNVIIEAEPHVKRVASRRYRPAVLWKKFKESISNLIAFQGELPGVLSSIAEKVEKGELNIRFKHENLEGLQDSLDNVSNRLTLAIIIAAMIIGSSMIITTGVEPHLFGYPAFGIFGYCVSGVLGLWLIYTIIRGKRY